MTAATLADSLAGIVGDTPAIPHTYYPGEQDHNIAALIITSTHTLSFSLRDYCVSGVPAGGEIADFRLMLRPNPSKTSFVIELETVGRQPVNVSIYSVRWRLVKRLLKDRVPRARISLTWEGDNEDGRRVAPGAYFAVVRQGDRTAAKKLILQR